MTTEKRGRGRPRGASSSAHAISLRTYGPLVEGLDVGNRTFVEIDPDKVGHCSRQIANALNNSPRFQGKTFSIRRMTALESRFGAEPVYLISIERKA